MVTPTLLPCTVATVRDLCEQHHGYGGAGKVAVYAFAVYEDDRPVAAFAWQPPPPGAARAVCPEEPSAVLALSRMVAVPKDQRRLRHISKPLRQQMKTLIDRSRWPVLITYSDEGQGHTGYVYKCSGWTPTVRNTTSTYEINGVRTSKYTAGGPSAAERVGTTTLQRWEHWACDRGAADVHMAAAGWHRVAVPGKVWKSGNPAMSWARA